MFLNVPLGELVDQLVEDRSCVGSSGSSVAEMKPLIDRAGGARHVRRDVEGARERVLALGGERHGAPEPVSSGRVVEPAPSARCRRIGRTREARSEDDGRLRFIMVRRLVQRACPGGARRIVAQLAAHRLLG